MVRNPRGALVLLGAFVTAAQEALLSSYGTLGLKALGEFPTLGSTPCAAGRSTDACKTRAKSDAVRPIDPPGPVLTGSSKVRLRRLGTSLTLPSL
jgi:hypothetical protein